jgi:hypothetical protein
MRFQRSFFPPIHNLFTMHSKEVIKKVIAGINTLKICFE